MGSVSRDRGFRVQAAFLALMLSGGGLAAGRLALAEEAAAPAEEVALPPAEAPPQEAEALAEAAELPASEAPQGLERPQALELLMAYGPDVVQQLEREGVVIVEHPSPVQLAGSEQAGAEGGAGWVWALVLFEQPWERTFSLLAQTERQREFRKELGSVISLDRYPQGAVDEHRLKVLFIPIVYRLRFSITYPERHLQWELDRDFDNGIDLLSGYWELYEYGEGRTLALFATGVRVGKALPGWLQDSITRRSVPNSLQATRRWVDSDGSWRP